MIIQCEKCQTKFRLDDSRVTDKGVKVRCTKCKHVFKVQKEGIEAETCEPVGAMPDFAATAAHAEESAAPFETRNDAVSGVPFEATPVEENVLPSETDDFSQFETTSFDDSAISFESDDLSAAGTENDDIAANETAVTGGEVDFSDFDFGDSAAPLDSPSQSAMSSDAFTGAMTEPAAVSDQNETPQGLDFSDDDMFGAVVQAAPEAANETISFDFEGDSFAESMDMSGIGQDSNGKRGALFSLDVPGETPFNLGEIDFGDELTSVAVQQVNPDDLKPSQEILFAPLAEAQSTLADDELTRSFLGEDATAVQQELPPLSIASRRKQSPFFGGLITVSAVLVISVLGYFGYSSFSNSKDTASLDTGKINVRAVTADFIENGQAGELLVISGEALNDYPKPRAALQVKVTVFDATGQSVATKMAYGGNPLTEEQLENLPLDKIEAAMANQFGDSLANMEVAPGKMIPFVVVLANLPKGAKDFAVQSAGSTVATGKQP